MPINAISGSWVAHVEGHPVTMRLTFRGGVLFESGVEAGAYAAAGDGVRGTMGGDCVLILNPDAAGFTGTMVTLRHGEGADLIEGVALVRDGH